MNASEKQKKYAIRQTRRRITKAHALDYGHARAIITSLPDNYISQSGRTRRDLSEAIDNIASCGNSVAFATYPDGSTKPISSHCNQHLVCSVCAGIREDRIRAHLAPQLDDLSKKYSFAYHVTFTIKDSDGVREGVQELSKALSRFRRWGHKGHNRKLTEWSKVRAAFIAFEAKRGKGSGKAHVHAHALLLCDSALDYSIYDQQKKEELKKYYGGSWIPGSVLSCAVNNWVKINGKYKAVSQLSRDWYTCTQGKGISIKPRKIKSHGPALLRELNEIMKYTLKPNAADTPFALEVLADLPGMRLFRTYGDFYAIHKIDETDSAKEKRWKAEPDPIVLESMAWDRGTQQYIRGKQHKPIGKRWSYCRAKSASATAQAMGQERAARSKARKNGATAQELDKIRDTFRALYSEIRKYWQDRSENGIENDYRTHLMNNYDLPSFWMYGDRIKKPPKIIKQVL